MSDADFSDKVIHYSGFLDLLRKLARLNPDIVQGSEPYWFPKALRECFAALVYTVFLRRKLFFPVLEIRNPKKNFGHVIGSGLIWLMRILAWKASFIIVLTDSSKKLLLENGVSEGKIVRLPWSNAIGLDLSEFTPRRDGTEKDFGTPHVALFVGNLIPIKGIEFLLEAFLEVKKSIPDSKLVMVGKGRLEGDIRLFAAKNDIASDLILVGQIKNNLVPSYFRSAQVTVLPSIELNRSAEQIGWVNVQSLACGTPVVTTHCGGIPEFVVQGINAFVVPQKDSRALAEAILKVFSDDNLRQRMSINAREFCQERYDVKRNVSIAEDFILKRL
jgi:glycosyltransferase involved in cell wall biosynthesis